jgi:phage shock protein PspC (stress-responsive transcriptional regulator)
MKKLKPSPSDKIVLGVCGGLATYFGWDATLLRVLFAIAIVLGIGSPVIVYLVLWVVMRYQ